MKRLLGIILTIISAASFGTLATFGRYAYAEGIDTYTLLFFRFGIAAVLMGILLALRGESLPRGKTLLMLVGMGAIGYVGQSYCYLTAIRYASAGLVALLLVNYHGDVVRDRAISDAFRSAAASGALALELIESGGPMASA